MAPPRVTANWMNTALQSKAQWHRALAQITTAGLRPHSDGPKNWDALAALDLILASTTGAARILDAGGASYSTLVEWLFLYGYRSLYVLNLAFEHDFKRGAIRYMRGDCTRTGFPDGHFDAVTCLSVIEHGVPAKAFLEECYRILRPGGLLIVSTDYWPQAIDTQGKQFYGVDVRVLTQEDIVRFVDLARSVGFATTGPIDFRTDEKAVHWKEVDLDYTFIVFALTRC